jgi:hypothetical protein
MATAAAAAAARSGRVNHTLLNAGTTSVQLKAAISCCVLGDIPPGSALVPSLEAAHTTVHTPPVHAKG